MIGGATPLSKIFGQPAPVGAKSPILNLYPLIQLSRNNQRKKV